MVTIMYFAPQLGQAKAIGSDLFGTQRAGICPQYGNSATPCLANFGQYVACWGHARDEARRIAARARASGYRPRGFIRQAPAACARSAFRRRCWCATAAWPASGMTVERAQIDRVCGPSKQIIVIQKQDCGGLALVHTVPSPSPSPTWGVEGTNEKLRGLRRKPMGSRWDGAMTTRTAPSRLPLGVSCEIS
jgi:hypothetical protein